MKYTLLFIYILSFLYSPTIVVSAPSLTGSSGLISIPTAESLRYKEVNIGFDYIIRETEEKDDYFYKINIGSLENWEIGIVGGKVPTEGVYVNIKYYLLSNNKRLPLSLAIGSENLGSKEQTSLYMVASKKVRNDLSAHLGFKAILTDIVQPGIMAGLSYFFNDYIEWIADIDEDQEIYIVNTGLRLYIFKGLVLNAAVIDTGNILEDESQYNIGLSYSKFF